MKIISLVAVVSSNMSAQMVCFILLSSVIPPLLYGGTGDGSQLQGHVPGLSVNHE